MANIYGVLSAVNGKLHTLYKDYNNESRANILNKVPDFMAISINRALDYKPDIRIDTSANVTVSKPIFAPTGDDFAPVYICIVGNIKSPIIDREPVIVDRKGTQGNGIAIVIGCPEILFSDTIEYKEAARILSEIYFGLLNTDPNIKYEADPVVLRLYKSQKVFIPSYDITMILAAILCVNINMRNWFFFQENDSAYPIDPEKVLLTYSEKDVPDNIREKLRYTMNKYGKNINDLTNSIGSGKLLKAFLYGDK